MHKTDEPTGRGIGPVLEIREALRVLQQKEGRPLDLEIRSLHLTGNLLELCIEDLDIKSQDEIKKNYGNAFGLATETLKNGKAFKKLQEIIKAQGGNQNIDSEDLQPGHFKKEIKADKDGAIKILNSENITLIAKALGAPIQKKAGIYLDKKIGEKFKKNDVVCTLYSENMYNLKEAEELLKVFPIFSI